MKRKQFVIGVLILVVAIGIAFGLGFWFGDNHDNNAKVLYRVYEWNQKTEDPKNQE